MHASLAPERLFGFYPSNGCAQQIRTFAAPKRADVQKGLHERNCISLGKDLTVFITVQKVAQIVTPNETV
jgi:hypothetical protein